jgi:hypothetical protein
MVVATGELIRAMNYVEDITATLRRICIYIPAMSLAVIGAGIMGRGIAHAAALGGYRTILEDLAAQCSAQGRNEIRANLDKAVELGKVNSAPDADAAFRRLEYAGSVEEAAREADLVIEAVPRRWNRRSKSSLCSTNLPPRDHSRFQHFFAQRHRDRQRHLPREEMRRDALFQSRAQDEAARSRARARNRRRNAGLRSSKSASAWAKKWS